LQRFLELQDLSGTVYGLQMGPHFYACCSIGGKQQEWLSAILEAIPQRVKEKPVTNRLSSAEKPDLSLRFAEICTLPLRSCPNWDGIADECN
jgi:hypothetical protein